MVSTRISAAQVPLQIKTFAALVLGRRVRKWSIVQRDRVQVGCPWHDADTETWAAYDLAAGEIGPAVTNSGWSEIAINFPPHTGTGQIPEGYCLVCVGTYPPRATIYAGAGATRLLQA